MIHSAKRPHKENPSGNVREDDQFSLPYTNLGNYIRPRRAYGGILDANSLQMLEEKRDLFCLLSFLIHNTKPVGHQVSTILNYDRVILC